MSRYRSAALLAGIVVIAVAAILSGCPKHEASTPQMPPMGMKGAGAPGATAPTGATLNGAGATFPDPLYKKWFFEFSKQNGTQVNYQAIGSGGGVKAITEKTVNFAGSDAPLSDKELAAIPGKILQLPSCGGSVCLAYNLEGLSKQLQLSPATLSGIYLGHIKKWNDPKLAADNPGLKLPDKSISVVHRSDGSGTTYLFTSYLAAISSDWKSSVGAGKDVKWPVGDGGKGNSGVAGMIKNVPGAIGYVELVYASQNSLSLAALKNRAGKYINPTLDSTTAGIAGGMDLLKKDVRSLLVDPAGADAYPIVGLTFLLVYQDQPDAASRDALVKLLSWCIDTTAQGMAPSLFYASLPADLVALNKSLIDTIK